MVGRNYVISKSLFSICLFGFILFFGQARTAQAQYLYNQHTTVGTNGLLSGSTIEVQWIPTSANSNWTVQLWLGNRLLQTAYGGSGQHPLFATFIGYAYNTLYTVKLIDSTDNYTYTEMVWTANPSAWSNYGYDVGEKGFPITPNTLTINMASLSNTGPYTITLREHSTGTIIDYAVTSQPNMSGVYSFSFPTSGKPSLKPNIQYDWAFTKGSTEDTNLADFVFFFYTLPNP